MGVDLQPPVGRGRLPWLGLGLVVGLVLGGIQQLLGAQHTADQLRAAVRVAPAAPLVLQTVLLSLTGLGFLAAATGLVLVRRWGWWLALAVPVVGALGQWALRLAFGRSASELAARPTAALLTLVVIALVWAILWWPGIRKRFEL